ncbi:cyclin-dependent kinase 2-associated protein 1-like [Meriones unguiculatus]|uniref:cyclin-dependent kinase 2-associated protein 1-like n=1 Tax=Meriones unguiculatus TaxID=10047 RepID=UPI00293E040F|nr:cyclin-dependent kinase 2-associated protein 1-like [Meriones unguiculatus]
MGQEVGHQVVAAYCYCSTVVETIVTSSQCCQLLSYHEPPSRGYTQGTGNSQSQSAELLAISEELGKEIGPINTESKSAMERVKRGIIHVRSLFWECLADTEHNASYEGASCYPAKMRGFVPNGNRFSTRSLSSDPTLRRSGRHFAVFDDEHFK